MLRILGVDRADPGFNGGEDFILRAIAKFAWDAVLGRGLEFAELFQEFGD